MTHHILEPRSHQVTDPKVVRSWDEVFGCLEIGRPDLQDPTKHELSSPIASSTLWKYHQDLLQPPSKDPTHKDPPG